GLWDGLGFPGLLAELAAIRFGFIAPMLAGVVWLIVYRPNQFRDNLQCILLTVPLIAALGLFLMMTVAQQEDANKAFAQYWPGFSALYYFVYAFLGMRLFPASLVGVLSFAMVCLAASRHGVQSSTSGPAILHLAILNVLGIIICARMETQDRTLFRMRQHHFRLSRSARAERLNAQEARDETLLENTRAEAALMLAQSERAKLALAIAERERFLSAAYHDLQQPLTTIGLYVRLAKDKLGEKEDAAIQSDLEVVESAAQDIALMFKGVRDTWEVGGVQPNIEVVNLYSVFAEIARELRERAERKGLALRIRESTCPMLRVRSDRRLLKRALSNLVCNAIKYTDRGGVVLGSVCLESKVRIDVWDTGIGIPPEFQQRIYDEYFQINNAPHDHTQGLGLGLSIVKRIEKNLPDHKLNLSSRPGKGSRFSLTVPRTSEHCPALFGTGETYPRLARNRSLEGKYIVIVEDDPANLNGMIQTLGGSGCIVEGVDSVENASRLFAERERCPDILVTDYLLRYGQTGLEAIVALRQHFEWAQDVPVLFVTGELELKSKLVNFKGVYDIHCKPIEPDIWLEKVSALLTYPHAQPHP
ncbi:MAG: ATP-binding protein, partial [Candidatus Methylumidiphilus sp.]